MRRSRWDVADEAAEHRPTELSRRPEVDPANLDIIDVKDTVKVCVIVAGAFPTNCVNWPRKPPADRLPRVRE